MENKLKIHLEINKSDVNKIFIFLNFEFYKPFKKIMYIFFFHFSNIKIS